MITHEEAFKALMDTLPRQIGSPASRRKFNASGIVQKYITQQEQFAKDVKMYFELAINDETSKKVMDEWFKIREKLIKELEI